MKNGKIAEKPKKERLQAYITPGLTRASIKFMALDENIDRYRKGKMSLLVSDALKAYVGIDDE